MSEVVLALETATEACSVALSVGGDTYERLERAPRQHTRLILPMIDAVMAEAGLAPAAVDLIAFGRGPGAFTGLRIAAGLAQGLGFSLGRPVAPVSSLAATALPFAQAHPGAQIVVAHDARMGEVYSASFQALGAASDELLVHTPEQVCSPAAVPAPSGAWLGVGSAWEVYAAVIGHDWPAPLKAPDLTAVPRAAAVARLASFVDPVPPEQALPVYLRDQVTQR